MPKGGKLNMCYDYLKLLISMNNGSDNLKVDYTEIKRITNEYEQDFLRWKDAKTH